MAKLGSRVAPMDARRLHRIWIQQQRRLREGILSSRRAADRQWLRALVDRGVGIYEAYYQARSDASRIDPIQALSAPWATELERAVYWIAGWRPNTLVHLLYSESGLRFEAQLPDLLLGIHSGDLGDLSPAQLAGIDGLQRRTVAEEDEIEKEMAEVQEGAAEPFPPSDSDLEAKAVRVGRILGQADELRMRTLRGLVAILDPAQAADLLVAMADLEIGIRGIRLMHEPDGGVGWYAPSS